MTKPHGADPIDVYVGQRLRDRRKACGLAQQTLAKALGITFQQVQKYERGANRVSASMLVRAAAILDVNLDFFVEDMPKAYGSLGTVVSDPRAQDRALRLQAAAQAMPQVLLISSLSRAQQRAIAAVIDVCATVPGEEKLEQEHRAFVEHAKRPSAASA